jgi:PAS domain S-box-containing protein
MRYFFSYCHFFVAIIYAILGVIILFKDHRSRLNQTCAAIFACFFLWSFAFVWMHHPETSKATAEVFEKVASVGWICFGFFHLWFAWIYTNRRPFALFKPIAAFFIVVPIILIYQQMMSNALIGPSLLRDFGWLSIWKKSVWSYVYFIYYPITVILGLYILYDYRKKTDNSIIKLQSVVLIVSGIATFVVGSVINILLPMVIARPFAPIADAAALIWAVGLAYVAIKYNMLDINPFIAAQRIITAMKDLLFLLDTHGRIISVNQSAIETLACSDNQLIGRPFVDIIAGTEAGRDRIAKTIIESPALTRETALAFGTGNSIPVSLSTSMIPGTGIVCVAHDISLQKQRTELLNEAKKRLETEVALAVEELQKTNFLLKKEIAERKQAALALMETEERFRVIYEHAPDGIFLVDTEGNFIDGNTEVRRILGKDDKQLKGQSAFTLGLLPGPGHSVGTDDGRPSKPGIIPGSTEATLVRHDGSTAPVEINSHRIKIGERNLILGVVRDLTHRKKAEQEAEELKRELHQAQKMEAIGRLAGGIAHDFNNLLGGIMGYAGLLRKKLDQSGPEETRIVQKIIEAARQASHRTAQLLAFARKGKYQIASVNMHDLIDDVVGLLENTIDRKISLKKNLAASAATVMGDRSQLHSAILNLGVNARDALPSGGDILFSTDAVRIGSDLAQNYPYAVTPGDFFKMVIADNGVGMDEKVRSRIFEPFFSTKESGKGTGLGLASVYGTIKHHNGFIEFWSEPGQGSVFTIYLPLSMAVTGPQEKTPQTAVPAGNRHGNILVVDDVQILREIAQEMLSDLGYTVHTCGDGYEALEWFREHCERCDLVIMDLTMPKLSGKECLLAMKKIKPSFKAIITSGHAMDNEINELLNEGEIGFLQKPFENEHLSEIVLTALSGATTHD